MGRSDVEVTANEVLTVCRRLELGAAEVYGRFASLATNPELKAVWGIMSEEETGHAAAVRRLMDRPGLAPPRISRGALDALVGRVDALRREAIAPGLDLPGMLCVATALELSEMDDLFDIACRAAGVDPEGGRAQHFSRLVEVAEKLGQEAGPVRHILASLKRRGLAAGAPAIDAAG